MLTKEEKVPPINRHKRWPGQIQKWMKMEKMLTLGWHRQKKGKSIGYKAQAKYQPKVGSKFFRLSELRIPTLGFRVVQDLHFLLHLPLSFCQRVRRVSSTWKEWGEWKPALNNDKNVRQRNKRPKIWPRDKQQGDTKLPERCQCEAI